MRARRGCAVECVAWFLAAAYFVTFTVLAFTETVVCFAFPAGAHRANPRGGLRGPAAQAPANPAGL